MIGLSPISNFLTWIEVPSLYNDVLLVNVVLLDSASSLLLLLLGLDVLLNFDLVRELLELHFNIVFVSEFALGLLFCHMLLLSVVNFLLLWRDHRGFVVAFVKIYVDRQCLARTDAQELVDVQGRFQVAGDPGSQLKQDGEGPSPHELFYFRVGLQTKLSL